jgi:hypothetical protein
MGGGLKVAFGAHFQQGLGAREHACGSVARSQDGHTIGDLLHLLDGDMILLASELVVLSQEEPAPRTHALLSLGVPSVRGHDTPTQGGRRMGVAGA